MIAIILFASAIVIAILDFSEKDLDSETENILYYDNTVQQTKTQKAQLDDVQEQSPVEEQPPAEEQPSAEEQAVASSGLSADEELERALMNAMGADEFGMNLSDELDAEDDFSSSADEVQISSPTYTEREISDDADEIFNAFKNRRR